MVDYTTNRQKKQAISLAFPGGARVPRRAVTLGETHAKGTYCTLPGQARRDPAILEAMYRSAYDNGGNWVQVKAQME